MQCCSSDPLHCCCYTLARAQESTIRSSEWYLTEAYLCAKCLVAAHTSLNQYIQQQQRYQQRPLSIAFIITAAANITITAATAAATTVVTAPCKRR
jgi:hypothetical protein